MTAMEAPTPLLNALGSDDKAPVRPPLSPDASAPAAPIEAGAQAAIDTASMPDNLAPVMTALANVAVTLSRTIARAELARHEGAGLGAEVGQNLGGDGQKALDVLADQAYEAALRRTDTRFYASEEQDEAIELNQSGRFAVALDPLDGSSNIDVNVSIGTIFSIFEAADNANDSFLRPANEQLAGGYIIFGPQCCLVVTFGDGCQMYSLDPDSQRFVLVKERLTVPSGSCEFAINASNYRHWPRPVRAYIDDCLAGQEGPRDKDFNMRWVASLVAETHRILSRGGIFLYPNDERSGYERGRLRLVYECAPIAFVIEQAGGKASDGCDPIMGKTAQSLHARCPLVFGSAEKVNRIAAYYDLPDHEVSALFGQRGLFRA